MNQAYAEAGVKRQETAASLALRGLIILGIVLGVLFMFLGGIFSIIGIVLVIVLGFIFPKLNVDYEYVYVDGQLDFDKITGKARRKTMLRIDFDQVEVMAPANSHALDEYTYKQLETKDYSSRGKDSKPYVIIVSKGEKRLKILFEPNEKMIEMIKQKAPRKVSVY
ncbi:MAG TPA: hypothetical protein DEG06_00055 [Lachnospiraceae bacterium]|jgi:hypothetical protein|nr:hypothetical protein [Lachnospiraceae bacterium]HBY70614.1 hypothetical protein [Lachnospiraceae bacterium]HCA70567.1 hypothetical protein [Lachnospiraceae bacterium]HCM13561.1 hypothetical protein [Lachnospiraceae bacterium]